MKHTKEQIAEAEAVFADQDGTRGVMYLNDHPVVDGRKAVHALADAYASRDNLIHERNKLHAYLTAAEAELRIEKQNNH